jgi:dolichol-phosphate mannosyltransferase
LLGLANRDLTSGFRVLPKELLEKLDLSTIQSIGYGFQIELALNAVRAGFEIEEVPITFIERENGESKMSLGIVFEAWKVVTAEGFKRVIVRR